MFKPKIYIVVCHGCGVFQECEAEFLSSPLALSFDDPDTLNRTWSIPCLGCANCMSIPIHGDGDDHPIRKAFRHGMTKEARERAKQEFLLRLPELRLRSAARKERIL